MELKNLERAANLNDLLASVKDRIKETRKLIKAGDGFMLNRFSDGSGASVDILFTEEGNYDTKTYNAIAEFALEQFETRELELIEIIKGL
jgi:hypothetical protein